MLTLSTIKGRERAVTLTLARGDWGHMLVVSTPSNICQYPGHYVSDVCPLPQFLDNRVVLLPIWKLPRRRPVPRSAIADKCHCLWDQGRPGVTFTVCQAKCFVSQPNSWTEYDTPSSPFRHGPWQNVNKQKSDVFFFFVWIPYIVFIISDWPGSILMCL